MTKDKPGSSFHQVPPQLSNSRPSHHKRTRYSFGGRGLNKHTSQIGNRGQALHGEIPNGRLADAQKDQATVKENSAIRSNLEKNKVENAGQAKATKRHKSSNRVSELCGVSNRSVQTNRGSKAAGRDNKNLKNLRDSKGKSKNGKETQGRSSGKGKQSGKKRNRDFKLKFWSPDPFETGEARVHKRALRGREGSEDVTLVTKKENLEEAQRRRRVEEFLKVLVDRTGIGYNSSDQQSLKKKIRSVFKGWKNNSVAEFFEFKSNKELYKIKVEFLILI